MLPKDFLRLTPGEYADLMTARAWVNQQQTRTGPMSDLERAEQIGKLDQKLARARGEHR